MRYLSALSTATIAGEVERSIGSGRLRPLGAGEDPRALGGERFGGIIADHAAQLPLLRHGLPVVLMVPWRREGLRQFRILAEDGVDVRLWTDGYGALSDATLRVLTGPRSPSPAATIVAGFRGRCGGLAADTVVACATLGNARRSTDEIARICDTSPSSIRAALRGDGLISVSGLIARMRCLHALWALEGGRRDFWSAAGFRTLAELSSHLSQHTGAPLGRWRTPGGYAALLQWVASDSSHEGAEAAAAG